MLDFMITKPYPEFPFVFIQFFELLVGFIKLSCYKKKYPCFIKKTKLL